MKVLKLASNKMGAGDDALGELLILGFLEEFAEKKNLPQKIVIYNSGVLLAKKGTATADALLKIEKRDVEIFLCGTCVNFYDLKSAIVVGSVSNMKSITNAMNEADVIISP